MAASANWRCADCDTYNGPAEAFCEACGGTRRGAASAKAPPAGRATGKGAAKPTPEPAAKATSKPTGPARPAAKRPGGGGRPAGNWRCAKCDTNNARTDLSCIVCGTGWRSSAKKTAPKPSASAKKSPGKKATPAGTPPKKPSPKRSTPAAPASRATPGPSRPGSSGAAAASSRPRPGTASGVTRPRSEAGVFFPSSGPGYRPAPTPTPTPPPRRPDPVHTPSPKPRGTPPRPAKQGGCGTGCLGFVLVLFVLGLLARGCDGVFDSGDDSSGSDDTRTAADCPARIAAEIPGGASAELVQAFRTTNKQITLCRTESGALYYYGEFSDGREPGIAMEAEETSTGFEARNGVYRYEIHDGVVTIYQSGTRIGEETLVPEPSPT
ncbi:hypothetical protein ACSLFT_28235 [Streptomyces sp. G6]|uniref:hypothetical protein n=1 Tax=Streptomyces sp. G6 TaxID=1178736 RepID=UPI003EDA2EA2